MTREQIVANIIIALGVAKRETVLSDDEVQRAIKYLLNGK